MKFLIKIREEDLAWPKPIACFEYIKVIDWNQWENKRVFSNIDSIWFIGNSNFHSDIGMIRLSPNHDYTG